MKRIELIILALVMAISVFGQEKNYPVEEINGQRVYKYVVEKSIGLYRLSVNFDCTQEEILKLNPQLRERGLHYGETIYVPAPKKQEPIVEEPAPQNTPEEVIPATTEETTPAPTTPIPANADTIINPAPDTITVQAEESDSTTIRLAIMLPLQTSAYERSGMMDRFADFYEGALLAIYDVQATGQKIDVKVYDTDKSPAVVKRIINSGALDDRQAIIGPAYPNEVNSISGWAKQNNVQLLIPFTNKIADIDSNPALIQFNAGVEQEAEAIAEYLNSRKDSVNCILVDARESDIPESVRAIRDAIRSKGIPYTTTNVHKILSDSLGEAIMDYRENYLLLNTEKYSNISVLMPQILNARYGKQLTLISRYSWQKEKIVLPQLYTTVFSTDVPADSTHYNELYQRYFHHAPAGEDPRYDLLGYDLTRSLLALMMGEEYFGIQSDIRLERINENGGMVNTRVQVIEK